ncbi:hypothetical protein GCM10027261_14470 [Geodermatophilus arenarius]|uniref:Uncharacterized protein n=1 Tax=Geodermatophilus arenarius TaxID=1137990 RepID=A0ABV9LHZ6_9ACTN
MVVVTGPTYANAGLWHEYAHGFSFARAEAKAAGIFDVALRVFETAAAEGVSPAVAADRLAEQRIASVGRLATIRLPR